MTTSSIKNQLKYIQNNIDYDEHKLNRRKEDFEKEKKTFDIMNERPIFLNYYIYRELGMDAALMFGALYSEYYYRWRTRIFNCYVERIKHITGLTAERQRKAIKILVDNKLIEYYMGSDEKHRRVRRFKITMNYEKLAEFRTKAYENDGEEISNYYQTLRTNTNNLSNNNVFDDLDSSQPF